MLESQQGRQTTAYFSLQRLILDLDVALLASCPISIFSFTLHLRVSHLRPAWGCNLTLPPEKRFESDPPLEKKNLWRRLPARQTRGARHPPSLWSSVMASFSRDGFGPYKKLSSAQTAFFSIEGDGPAAVDVFIQHHLTIHDDPSHHWKSSTTLGPLRRSARQLHACIQA